MGEKDTWFSRENEQLDIDFEKVRNIFRDIIIPFFEKYSSLGKLVDNYSSGSISKQNAFGLDVGWQCFNAGFSYAALNKNDEAMRELKELIREHSEEEYDWVQERKNYAQKKLSELESA